MFEFSLGRGLSLANARNRTAAQITTHGSDARLRQVAG
jgi:hypothetical protein